MPLFRAGTTGSGSNERTAGWLPSGSARRGRCTPLRPDIDDSSWTLNDDGRSLQLDDVAFRVGHVQRRALAFCTVAGGGGIRCDACSRELGADRPLVEGLQSKTEVIQVASFAAGRRAARAAELAVHRNEIEHRSAGAELHEADSIAAPIDGATEQVTIERDHRLDVDNAQHNVVDVANRNHSVALT